MTAPKNYCDRPAPVEEPNRNGRSQLRLLEPRRRRSPETAPTPVIDADIPLSHDTEDHVR
jgi:hypothetical protein